MHIDRKILYLGAAWVMYLLYLWSQDEGSFWVSAGITPPFALIAYAAYRSGNLVLQFFTLFAVIGHVLGAPYFWLTRENYTYAGFGAVKDFNFDPSLFSEIYAWCLFIFAATAGFVLVLDRRRRFVAAGAQRPAPGDGKPFREGGRLSEKRSSALLLILIVLVGAPLNVYMARNLIGITGLVSEELPFRLVGVMYYSRLYLIPLLLTWLFSKSTRGVLLFGAIIAYSLLAGFSSASRTVLLLSLMPLILDIYFHRRRASALFLASVAALAFVLVSASRDYTYASAQPSYLEMAENVVDSLAAMPRMTPMSVLGGIANRFYGAQDMVLAYQYEPTDPYRSFVDYLWSGGAADSVVRDLNQDFFGMTFTDGSGFGFGIGLAAYLLMLGRAAVPLILLGPLIVALLISVADRCVVAAFSGPLRTAGPYIKYFAAMLLAFSLYSSSLNLFYLGLEILLLICLVGANGRPRISPGDAEIPSRATAQR